MLAIVLELQAHGRRRAEDLAATFEVSRRTIYRDVQALCETGVPVIAEPGSGYSLVDGYFLPPIRFSGDEALMLLFGADLMAYSFDTDYAAAASAAARKIAGLLTPTTRDEVASLREQIHFVQPASALAAPIDAQLRLIRHAIIARRAMRCRYRRAGGETAELRVIDPYALVSSDGVWYVSGYCHLRGAPRVFRLSRMDALELLLQRFERPPQISLAEHRADDRSIEAKVLIAPPAARQAQERRSFFTIAEEPTPDGLLVTLLLRDERDIIGWVLNFGGQARVIAPTTLRELVHAEARAILGAVESGADRC